MTSTASRRRLDQAEVDRQLREGLQSRAERLGIDPLSITSPTPGALIARAHDGELLRVDFRTYASHELER